MFLLFCCLFSCAVVQRVFVCLLAIAAASAQPIVQTTSGPVEGVVNGPVQYFKGIPYAATTAGSNRWLPPMPRPAWSGVLNASALGPGCYQVRRRRAPAHYLHFCRCHCRGVVVQRGACACLLVVMCDRTPMAGTTSRGGWMVRRSRGRG